MAGPVLDDLRQKFQEIVLSHLFRWRGEPPELSFMGGTIGRVQSCKAMDLLLHT